MRYSVCQFSGKNFQKTNLIITTNILDLPWVPIFRHNRQLWLFRHKFAQEWILRSEFWKSMSRFGITTAKTDIFEFFGLNLGKLPNYVRYFGPYNVEGVVESWVEAEMSWVVAGKAGWKWMELGGGECMV